MNKPLVFLVIIFLIAASTPAHAALDKIFSDNQKKMDSLKPFPKWRRVLSKHPEDKKTASDECKDKESSCFMQKWQKFIEDTKSLNKEKQIEAVNSEMNKSEYITDIVNWGVQDYWETPLQFLRNNGDCEDYAIAKFYTLRELGFDNNDMRITILMDNNINAIHSVLVVNIDGKHLVLDNQVKTLVEAEKIQHYMPIYSVNESSWWRHQ